MASIFITVQDFKDIQTLVGLAATRGLGVDCRRARQLCHILKKLDPELGVEIKADPSQEADAA